ncbi:MAG: protein disulfide oxidoreductase, partial [Pseudonocardiaceae bacterium]
QQTGGSPGSAQDASARPTATGAEQLRFTAMTIDHDTFSGQSLAGKPAVLWFWTPWCPTCQREAPGVAEVAHAYPGVTFVGVAAQGQVPAMREFVSEYGVGSFTHLADLDAEVWRRFGVTVQPAFAFVGTDGSVQVVKGTLPEQELTERVGALAGA